MFEPYSNLFGNFPNRKFSDIFPEEKIFIDSYKSSGIYDKDNTISDKSLTLLYYLLYSRYANSTIASFDENQFRYKVYSTIFMYGPSWEKRLDIQSKIRALSEEDIIKGAKRINNHSYNPSSEPSTSSLEELTTINEQFAEGWKKSKLEGYATLINLISTDVTEELIGKFKKLFITVVEPNLPLWYKSEDVTF